MALQFDICAWAACAPALQTHADWQAWSQAPWLPQGADLPALAAMAPMLRRRVNAIGRAALHPAYDTAATDEALDSAGSGQTPAVFASRHGDSHRAYEMLCELAADQPLSPTAFGLSVHNAIGALFSIDRADTANVQAIAGGRDTVETAIVEACGLLADGADEVLVVCYDAPLPGPYSSFINEPQALFGWAWRIGRPGSGSASFSLDIVGAHRSTDATRPLLPHGLDVLRFMLAGEPTLRHRGEQAEWRWQRHG
ncbi:beta-ketoacyl synthase chain length factor [Cupriavidus pauculus]|uniref:beta-ketoacyl synthase chain length factor n=1 Tax=Cupriavidus pauculus TaxID=82633 RepID=UPI001D0C6C4F|nr:beta-ketoacyl synthase chain length factor [Cupriavidus pauculus]